MDPTGTTFSLAGFEVDWRNATAFLVATLTVALLIYGRHEIRLRRLAALRDYLRIYPLTASFDSLMDTGAYDLDPSFEYAKSKYSSDLGVSGSRSSDPQDRIAEIEFSIRRATFFRGGTVSLLVAGTGYWGVVFSGFLLALGSFSDCGNLPTCGLLGGTFDSGATSTVAAPETPTSAIQVVNDSLTIASFAFIGAYAASVRYMLRALSTFDLTAFTFIRHAAMIALSTILVMAFYRATAELGVAVGVGKEVIKVPGLLVALALGLLPGSIFQFILTRARDYIDVMKSTDDRFIDWTRVVPLDVIDGIDHFTRFRLEECGISDVQALATYNPIMLHIETPFRIFQVLDWITQAQLCCVVGVDRFLLLRQFNIRTIFDLERALKEGRTGDIEQSEAIDRFDHIFAGILFSPNSAMRGVETISHVRLLIPDGHGTKEVSASEYSSWARSQINVNGKMLSFAIEHLMTWISDDLHVRRARRIWNEISVQLGPASLSLYGDPLIRRGGTAAPSPAKNIAAPSTVIMAEAPNASS